LLLKELEEEATYLYHPDHLGSVSVVSDQKGLPYERVEYLPFGEVWIEETDPATGYIPFRFTSKELDEETGLYYHGARYYEPTISRWMSADPAGFALSSPMGSDGKPKASYSIIEAVNWYAYVSNNPVIYVDPTGMYELDYDEQGNATIQAEIENKNDIREAVSRFYSITEAFPEGDHNIQFIDREGNILGDYSSYPDALTRSIKEWPHAIVLTPGIGAEVLNIGFFVGFGPKGPEASISFFLATFTAYIDSEGNERIDADVAFTLLAMPGLKVDVSLKTFTKNYFKQSFYKVFGSKKYEP